jgi:hypothetical protein
MQSIPKLPARIIRLAAGQKCPAMKNHPEAQHDATTKQTSNAIDVDYEYTYHPRNKQRRSQQQYGYANDGLCNRARGIG